MSNRDARIETATTVVDVYDEPEGVTTGTGSYGLGHGMSLRLHAPYVGEVTDEQLTADFQELLRLGVDRLGEKQHEIGEHHPENFAFVPRDALETVMKFVIDDPALDSAPDSSPIPEAIEVVNNHL